MRQPSNQQKNAIKHLFGPAEIIAGPGSGKTFTIIQRLLYLIRYCQIDPDSILVITYTKAAAKEMSERFKAAVSELCGNQPDTSGQGRERDYEKVHFGTFHSICYQILRQSGGKSYSLIGESQKRELIGHLLKNAGHGEKVTYDLVSDIVNQISREKNLTDDCQDGTPHKAYGENAEQTNVGTLPIQEYLKIKEKYERHLKEQSMIDFDDMIVECLRLFDTQPAVLRRYQSQFAYILADEFQDINPPQYRLLKLLAAPKNNLFVVGDDDQAIYGFRGATPGIMKQFLLDFPEGKQLMLTENYRSGSKIVQLAKKVISRNRNRFEKEFRPMNQGGGIYVRCLESRKEEERALVETLSGLGAKELEQSAVIFRTNLELMQYQELFRASGIPVSGKAASDTDILRSFIMEDMTAFLSFVYLGNKRSDLIRFLNKPNRFFLREALTEERVTWPCFLRYYEKNPELLKQAKGFWDQLTLAGKLRPGLALSLFRNALGYDRYLEEKAPDARKEMLWKRQAEQISRYLEDYVPGTDLKRYLAEKEKQAPAKEEMVTQSGLRLCTMHGAKGLEFDRVYLPDLNEGVIPGRRCQAAEELEEERRLLYVAITRAKKELYLFYTRERGRAVSRYLEGLIPPPPRLP